MYDSLKITLNISIKNESSIGVYSEFGIEMSDNQHWAFQRGKLAKKKVSVKKLT